MSSSVMSHEDLDPDDVTMGTTIGAMGEVVEFPRYKVELAPAKPFLMPSFDDQVIEILPSEKANKKIVFDEHILVQEIENRFAYAYPEDDDDDSYEIEIVEDDGEADFYLEIVDGEVFYVFETEDDLSSDEEEDDDDDDDDEVEDDDSDEEDMDISERANDDSARQPLNFPIDKMSAPNLDDDDDESSRESSAVGSLPASVHSTGLSNSGSAGSPLDMYNNASSSTLASEGGSEVEALLEVHDDDEDSSHHRDQQCRPVNEVPSGQNKDVAPAPSKRAQPPQVQVQVQEPSSPTAAPQSSLQISPPSSPQETQSSRLDYAPTTPVSPKKPSVGGGSTSAVVDQVPEPVSPIAQRIAPATPTSGRKSPARSILKACPESPKKAPTPKKKKKKGERKQRSFSKTYVRPEEFDGEHRVYSWEKPDWTKAQLKSTDKGDLLRTQGNLANPITFPKGKKVNATLDEDESENNANDTKSMDRQEILKRIINGDANVPTINLPGYRGRQKMLKFSVTGAKIRDGGDLSGPITKATVNRKPNNINYIANPNRLRTTDKGSQVKEGKNLAAPVTMATVIKKREDINHVANKNVLKNKGVQPVVKKQYEWEKPAWARASLKSSKGRKAEGGGGADSSGEFKPAESDGSGGGGGEEEEEEEEEEAAAGGLLKPTGLGSKLRKGAEPVEKKKYTWEKPEWAVKKDKVLRSTGKGEGARKGGNLAQPITMLPDLAKDNQ